MPPLRLENTEAQSKTGILKKTMATRDENQSNLTSYQYVRLGQVISCTSMESIALGYMNIDKEKIKQRREVQLRNPEGFVRDIIEEWACRNPKNQVQVRSENNGFFLEPRVRRNSV